MNNSNLSNPHDKFFKESFSRRDVAGSFIREYLPRSLVRQVNLKSLRILKDSYVDKELAEHFSDLVYSVRVAGKASYIYLLFEHKSYMDPRIGFQLLRNMVKMWEQHLKTNPDSLTLPVIVPLVIYHGARKWRCDTTLLSLFEDIPGTREYIPEFRSEVFDVSHLPDDEIRGAVLLRVLFLTQKYLNRPQFFDKLHDILTLLVSLSGPTSKTEFLEVLLRYLAATIDSQRMPDLKRELKKSLENGETLMPTIAEKWLQEGIEQGIERGIERGKLEDAQRMVDLGMSSADICAITALPLAKIRQLKKKKA